MIWRALVPRWNLFDRVQTRVRVEVRAVGQASWQELALEARREPLGLFVNPSVTRLHAESNVVDAFVAQLERFAESSPNSQGLSVALLESWSSYRAVVSLVRFRVRERAPDLDRLQFRLTAERGDHQQTEVMFVSHEIAVGPNDD